MKSLLFFLNIFDLKGNIFSLWAYILFYFFLQRDSFTLSKVAEMRRPKKVSKVNSENGRIDDVLAHVACACVPVIDGCGEKLALHRLPRILATNQPSINQLLLRKTDFP